MIAHSEEDDMPNFADIQAEIAAMLDIPDEELTDE